MRKCGVCVTLLNITLLFCVWLLICVVLGHKLKEGRRKSERHWDEITNCGAKLNWFVQSKEKRRERERGV